MAKVVKIHIGNSRHSQEWEAMELLCPIVGVWIGMTILENSLEIPSWAEQMHISWPSNHISGYVFSGNGCLVIQRPMFLVALFVLAKNVEQLKHPSTKEWTLKLWYAYIYINSKNTTPYWYMQWHGWISQK